MGVGTEEVNKLGVRESEYSASRTIGRHGFIRGFLHEGHSIDVPLGSDQGSVSGRRVLVT